MFDSPGCRWSMPYGEFVTNWAHFARRFEAHCVTLPHAGSGGCDRSRSVRLQNFREQRPRYCGFRQPEHRITAVTNYPGANLHQLLTQGSSVTSA